MLSYSHHSPLSGAPDIPESYHTVTISLSGDADATHVHLAQDRCASEDERAQSQENWSMMLRSLKEYLEAR